MLITVDSGSGRKTFNPEEGKVVSIPLEFNGPQPSAYGVSPAESKPLAAGDFIGSVAQGGSANCPELSLIPHCQGTHTESIEHILKDKVPISNVLGCALVHEARLVTVTPEAGCSERYQPPLDPEDRVISRRALEEALKGKALPNTIIIRTSPNDDSKMTRDYSENPPPFFTNDAMEFLVASGISHLMVDVPSVDKAWDEGKLSNHRIYWNVAPGEKELRGGERLEATITEMIYVPSSIGDGEYMVSIQTPDFKTDAAPSKVVVYEVMG